MTQARDLPPGPKDGTDRVSADLSAEAQVRQISCTGRIARPVERLYKPACGRLAQRLEQSAHNALVQSSNL